MRYIAAISSLLIIGLTSATTPASAEISSEFKWETKFAFKWYGKTEFTATFPAPKRWVSNVEIKQVAEKTGVPLEVGLFTFDGSKPKGYLSAQVSVTARSRDVLAQSDPDKNLGPSIRKTSPSALDISGEPPGTRRIVIREEGDTYDPVLRRRALELYPNNRQARLLWMAAQEQQAIQNEINSSKPLIYPVGSR